VTDDRLPTHLLVGAMLRRANDQGGMGMVLARGDAQGGGILIVAVEPGGQEALFERAFDLDGKSILRNVAPNDDPTGYWRRRRERDRDLWVIELTVAGVERFIAETIASN